MGDGPERNLAVAKLPELPLADEAWVVGVSFLTSFTLP